MMQTDNVIIHETEAGLWESYFTSAQDDFYHTYKMCSTLKTNITLRTGVKNGFNMYFDFGLTSEYNIKSQ
jgi:hypothetical protein